MGSVFHNPPKKFPKAQWASLPLSEKKPPLAQEKGWGRGKPPFPQGWGGFLGFGDPGGSQKGISPQGLGPGVDPAKGQSWAPAGKKLGQTEILNFNRSDPWVGRE